MPNGASKDNRSTRYMQLGLGWIFVGAYAVENGRLSQIAVLGASSLYGRSAHGSAASDESRGANLTGTPAPLLLNCPGTSWFSAKIEKMFRNKTCFQ